MRADDRAGPEPRRLSPVSRARVAATPAQHAQLGHAAVPEPEGFRGTRGPSPTGRVQRGATGLSQPAPKGGEPPCTAPAGPSGGPRPRVRAPLRPPAEQRHKGNETARRRPFPARSPARPELRRHVRGRRGPARDNRRVPAARAGKTGRAEGAGGPAPLSPTRRSAAPLRAEPCLAARPDPAARAVPLPALRPPGPGPAASLTSLSCRSAASRSAGSMVPRRASMMVLGSMPAAAGGGGQGPGPRRAVRTWTRRLAAAAGAKGREAPKARIERPPPPPARQRRPSAARAPPRAARPHGSCSSGVGERRHRLLRGRARRCPEGGLTPSRKKSFLGSPLWSNSQKKPYRERKPVKLKSRNADQTVRSDEC